MLQLLKKKIYPQIIIKIIDYFSLDNEDKNGIHDSAQIDPNAIIGKNVFVGSNTVIDSGVKI